MTTTSALCSSTEAGAGSRTIGQVARRTATVVSLCVAAVALCSGNANAAPGDVTTVSAVSGNIATATITNRSAAVIGCKLFGLPAGSVANSESRPPFGYVNPVDPSALILPGTARTVTLEVFTDDGPNGSTALPDGVYDLYWGCTTVPNVDGVEQLPHLDGVEQLPHLDGVEQWGTLAPAGGVPTAETSRLVVPGVAPEAPLPPSPTFVPGPCYDAGCLPPDLADVVDDLWNELTSP